MAFKDKKMHFSSNRNWLLTIAHINLPFVLWATCILTIIVIALTFCFKPIYSATTIITLDSDLDDVLKTVDISYPSVTATHFIRYEYFATHNVNLMRAPQLAEKFVSKWNIRNYWGDKLFSGHLVQPGIFRLLFSNNGQAIDVDWISDTQQFSITGYSKNPDRAVAYSRDYTDTLLKQNVSQFRDVFRSLIQRLETKNQVMNKKIEEIDQQIQQIKIQHRTANLTSEIDGLNGRILQIKTELDNSRLDEKTYQMRIEYLSREMAKYKKLQKYEHIMETNPQIDVLKSKIEELTGKLVAASVDYTQDHPEYRDIEKKLNNAKETFRKETKKTLYQETERISSVLDTVLTSILEVSVDHVVFQSKMKHYSSILVSYHRRLNELAVAQSGLENLAIKKDTLTDILSNANNNLYTIENMMNKSLPFFRVVSQGNINKDRLKYYKYFPKRKRILVLSFLACFFTFSFLVIAKELYANIFYYGWQISALKNHIDYVDVPNLRGLAKKKSAFEPAIRKHIHEICLATKDSQIIRIASVVKGEGKTTIARALAWYCRKTGKSVVLVDGDIEHHSMSLSFGLDDRPGLIDYLYGQKQINGIIAQDRTAGISIIPVGSRHILDLDMPVISRLDTLFSTLRSDYEKIIFLDSPSSGNHLMLADNLPSHDVIIVLRSGEHSIYEVEHMVKMQELTRDQAILRGIVVNRIPFTIDVHSYNKKTFALV